MRIRKAYISGFRSVSESASIEFAQSESGAPMVTAVAWPDNSFSFDLRRDLKGHDLTGLVGPNNAGKSNVLRAFLLFFSNLDREEISSKVDLELDFHCYGPNEQVSQNARICIEFEFDIDAGDESEGLQDFLLSDADPDSGAMCLGCVWKSDGLSHWYVRRGTQQPGVEEIGTDLRHAKLRQIAAHMPRFYWLPTGADTSKEQQIRGSKYLKRLIDDVIKEIKVLQELDAEGAEQLSDEQKNLRTQLETTQQSLESLRDCLEELKQLPSPLNELASSLVFYMQPIMPGVKAWFEYASALPIDYWQWLNVSMIRLDDGWPTSISEKGHGSQRTFAIALLQTYAAYKAKRIGDHPFLIAIEEPEIYMHPHIARALSSTLQSLSETGQVVFSTHSPTFVEALEWENLILVRKPGAASETRQLVEGALGEEQREVIRRNVDAQECEMFFARLVVLVEGPTERFAIPGLVGTLKKDTSHPLRYNLDEMGVSIVDVGGAQRFEPFLMLLSNFGISTCLLADADAIGDVASQLRSSGLVAEEEMNEFNGFGADIDGKRDWLQERGCFILDNDFEVEIARALSDKRVWEVVNEARRRKGNVVIAAVQFPGETDAQVEEMVADWTSGLWKTVKHSVARSRRDPYQDRVLQATDETRNFLRDIAEELIAANDWARDSREKWLASKLARQGKPLVGLVLGDLLTAQEIQSCATLGLFLEHLAKHSPNTE